MIDDGGGHDLSPKTDDDWEKVVSGPGLKLLSRTS
jgi:hypothetical protein